MSLDYFKPKNSSNSSNLPFIVFLRNFSLYLMLGLCPCGAGSLAARGAGVRSDGRGLGFGERVALEVIIGTIAKNAKVANINKSIL